MGNKAIALSGMQDNELDSLPFGAIQLDKNGDIISYNATEEKISGRSANRVIGKNFFSKVAPCTASGEFKTFWDEIGGGSKEEGEFDFVFTFNPPVDVHIKMLADRRNDSVWILVETI